MIRGDIAYYTKTRVPVSLRDIVLCDFCSIDDIFNAVDEAMDTTDLTNKLCTIINQQFFVDRVTDKYIRYIIIDRCNNRSYLKIRCRQ